MSLLVLVNEPSTVKQASSTGYFIGRLHDRGHRVFVGGVASISTEPSGTLMVQAAEIASSEGWVRQARRARKTDLRLDDFDAIWLRISPGHAGNPRLHALLLQQLQQHVDRGGLVLNDPTGLMRASSKLYLHRFAPWTRPHTLVSASVARLRQFVGDEAGPCVFKPVDGSQGRDVFYISGPDDPNLTAIAAHLRRSGPVMAQTYLPEATEGDVRVLLLDGEAIVVDGAAAVVRRRPAPGEFRSNVHLGGSAESAVLTGPLRRLIASVGPVLRQDGMFLVGLDVVGDTIVEVNVFSPGGFQEACEFSGRDFYAPVCAALEARLTAHRSR